MRDLVDYADTAKRWMTEREAKAYNDGLQYGIDAIRAWLDWHGGSEDALERIDWYVGNKLPKVQVKLDAPNE